MKQIIQLLTAMFIGSLFSYCPKVNAATEGKSIGSSDVGFYGLASGGPTTFGSTTANGWKLGLGYDWNRYFALEIAYQDLDNEHDRNSGACNHYGNFCMESTIKARGYNIGVIGKLPLSDSIEGLLGVSYGSYSFESNRSVHYVGVTPPTNYPNDQSLSAPLALIGMQFDLDTRSALRITYEVGNWHTYDPSITAYKWQKTSMEQLGMVVRF